MTSITQFEATDGGLVLTNAILLYRSAASPGANPHFSPRSAGSAFASIHAVEQDQGRPTIAAGAPLSRADLRQWTEALGRTEAPEILPDTVLVSHPDVIAWWAPAMVRPSYFALTKPPKDLRVLAARTVMSLPYPAHLFVATRRRLGVYALPVSARPTADTVVHHSPVLNVYLDGNLCWGNIPVPKSVTLASIPDYERAVFDSWSTHPNPGQENTVKSKGGLVRLWDDLAASKATRFPVGRLKPFDPREGGKAAEKPTTLGMLIARSVRT